MQVQQTKQDNCQSENGIQHVWRDVVRMDNERGIKTGQKGCREGEINPFDEFSNLPGKHGCQRAKKGYHHAGMEVEKQRIFTVCPAKIFMEEELTYQVQITKQDCVCKLPSFGIPPGIKGVIPAHFNQRVNNILLIVMR